MKIHILKNRKSASIYVLVCPIREEAPDGFIIDDFCDVQYTSFSGIFMIPVNQVSHLHAISRKLHNQCCSRMPFVNKISICLPLHDITIPGVAVSTKLDHCFSSSLTSIPFFKSFFLIFNPESSREVTSNLVTGLQINSCTALSHDLPNFNEYLLKDTDRFVMRLGV